MMVLATDKRHEVMLTETYRGVRLFKSARARPRTDAIPRRIENENPPSDTRRQASVRSLDLK